MQEVTIKSYYGHAAFHEHDLSRAPAEKRVSLFLYEL